jgi:large repetitive protein
MLISQNTPKNVGIADHRLHRRRRRPARLAEYFGTSFHRRPGFDVMEDRVLLSTGPANPSANAPLLLPASVMNSAIPIGINSLAPGTIGVGGANFYEIQPGSDSGLIAQTENASNSLELRLSLYDGQGNLLVQSDGQSSGRPNPLIDQHVAAGTDYLEVQSLAGAGTYTLLASLTPSSDPGQTVVLPPSFQGSSYEPIAVGDFTNNGILDIVAPDGVHLGLGDGTFEAAAGAALVDPSLNEEPSAIAVGDFNGDGNLDAAVALAATDSISISMGNGNGTFQPATTIGLSAGSQPVAIVAGDFLGNGHTDLAVADAGTNSVSILLGNGDGTFQVLPPIAVGQGPVAITEGEFENNGQIDLAVANSGSGSVTVLLNQGGGNFQALSPIQLPALGASPTSIVAGTFGNGFVDLAVTDSFNNVVDIIQGDGTGAFSLTSSYTVGVDPVSIVAGDFGNGQLDLATANSGSSDVSVLLGNGDGTFQPAVGFAVGTFPSGIATGDFTGNGRLDMVAANVGSNDISVLLGKGNGSFEEETANLVGEGTTSVATGDFTGNGNLGLAVLNAISDTITILPGNGDGTFQAPLTVDLPPGSGATSIVAADFNDDGRTDLAVADNALNEVSIFLGNGDGTFDELVFSVPEGPSTLVAGDFTGSGRVDLAVTDEISNAVTILLGDGHGSFDELAPIVLAPSSLPNAIVAGNFTDGGHLDLAVASPLSNTVTILLGNGDGTFQALAPIPLPGFFASSLTLTAGDFTGNGITDLAAASSEPFGGNMISVLLGNGDGTFQVASEMATSNSPTAIVAGNFTNNGIVDLATADANGDGSDDYSVYLGNGDGTFQAPISAALNGSGYPTAMVTGDFTGDGETDLAITLSYPADVQVQLSNGNGTFSSPSVVDLVRRETPLVADITGDGAPDVTVVDAAGNILFRAGRPGEPGSFAPPATVNPGDPSRDIAFVTTVYGPTIASVDADDNEISFFVLRSSGFVLVAKLATGSEPAEILSADLSGNGITDLIVRNAGDGTLSVYSGDGHGWFLPPVNLQVGLGAADIEVADLEQDGLLDIVYTNRISGQVGVIENLGGGDFGSPVIYRAGPGPYGVIGNADPSPVTSLEGTMSVAIGSFTAGGFPSLVALNPGSNTFALLTGLGDGRFSNPSYFTLPVPALVVRAVNFSGNGLTALAVLTASGLYIYVPDGHGGFLPPLEYDVGFEPTSLAVANLNGNGNADLLISNPLGDVQVLIGNGDGTFSPVQSLDQQVRLAVYAPYGTTPAAFIFSDQATDQVIVQTVGGVTTILGDASTGSVSPGAVELADLNNDGILDLIVADSGSNNVLVYPGLGNGAFGPALNDGQGFFTGTDPVGITVADLTGDGRLDLIVANEGSNDVSILLNEPVGNSFTFVQGPLLRAGVGPASTVLANVLGNGAPDLVIANSGSNNVWLLPALGNGFFNDQSPTILPVGTEPSAVFVGQFSTGLGLDLVTINAGSNSVTVISDLGSLSPLTESISSGGIYPTSAFAVPLTASGSEGLVVANNADGKFSLFEPGANGLALSAVFSSPALPNPSGLALASLSGANLDFYATTDGEASASLMALSLGGETLTQFVSDSGFGTLVNVTQLVPLNESSLVPFGSLLTVTIASQGSESSSESGAIEVAASNVLSPGDGESGLTLMWTEVEPVLPSPTDLAYLALTGGEVQFYAATGGLEAATLVSLSLSGETLAQSQSGSALGTVSNVAQLVPLNESSLALVGSLLTLTIASPASELDLESNEFDSAASVGLSSVTSASFGQSATGPGERDDARAAEVEVTDDVNAVLTNIAASAASAWERFFLGLDEALDRFRDEFQGRILGPPEEKSAPDTVGSPPAGISSAPDGPTTWRSTPGTAPASAADVSPESLDGARVVDVSIHAICGDDEGPLQRLHAVVKIPIRFVGTDSVINVSGGRSSGFPAIKQHLGAGYRNCEASRPDNPEAPSLPLALATFVTGWTLLSRTNSSRFHRATARMGND